jgi:acyl dehydratase
MLVLNGIDDAKAHVGQEIGVSRWVEITQESVDKFAEATGDDQFIHIDPERAKQTPFGGTIAHGYMVLSLIPRFSYEMFKVENVAFALNYGANRVRFPSPVRVGSRVRMRAVLSGAEDVPGGAQLTTTCTFEVEGTEKPACVAEVLSRLIAG